MTIEKVSRTSTHWGAYDVKVAEGRIVAVEPFAGDPNPSSIGQSIVDGIQHESRIEQPMVRRGWRSGGRASTGNGRGSDPFVPVGWDDALDLVAGELDRIRGAHGNAAIFGGCYGWASAGRFHHAQSQTHRFLNLLGGYTSSVNSYSYGAAEVIIPRVLGHGFTSLLWQFTSWPVIARHTGLVVMFGGIPLKNSQVSSGGIGGHATRDWLKHCRDRGVAFVNIGPIEDDAADFLAADWLAPRPNSDTALMLGLAHTLLVEGLHDSGFLETHCVGFERFRPYLLGETDGQPKSADWAAEICALPAETIRALARRMAANRTLISVSWSLQRSDHGEQPYWMAAVLAAMLGQIGLPGGGIGYGYGATGAIGNPVKRLDGMALPQGRNPVETFIPVARIADMLLHPGSALDYNGHKLTYPDIRLVYWCGGNPFHHHQDLNRLVRAWQCPETIVVHEPWWNANARHADIVLPATTSLERNDIGRAGSDPVMFAMHQAIAPVGAARNDHDIFAALADRLGFREAFTEGRGEIDWLRHLYDVFRQKIARERIELPDFDEFWELGHVEVAAAPEEKVLFEAFRRDPERHPLPTPSGRIEVFSEAIDGFGYDDCPGHPVWLEPAEWLGDAARCYPLHLISHQPATRLHSQLDCAGTSLAGKVQGREALRIHPDDAAPRGIADGDVVRVFNDRGECLAGARVTRSVQPEVVVLPTGAWYDPERLGGLDRHGNPNVLTRDKGTSRLAQATTAHTALVEIEKLDQDPPAVQAHKAPAIVS